MENIIIYGIILSDYEWKDVNRFYRLRRILYNDKQYEHLMCDGEVIKCEEI